VNELNGISLFIKVVESKSFTEAAEALSISPSAVSKQISRLEDRLGVQLLNRTTRRLGLTEAGAAFYERSARIMAEVEEAEALVTTLHKAPRGLLRVAVPMLLGQLHIAPLAPAFLAQYPEVRLELVFSDRTADLIEEELDLAIRVDELPDSTLVARRLAPHRRVLCGAPAYFARRGVPQKPEDLARHNCLTYGPHHPSREWFFKTGNGRHAVEVSGTFLANNAEALRQAALGGVGLALLPTFLVGGDLSAGLLRSVLADRVSADTAIYAVYPQHRHQSPKVRAFADFLTERIGPRPSWDRFAEQAPPA
jgi:DNA-binding transcriptional LysR family regulator